jgi:hypothetical protein
VVAAQRLGAQRQLGTELARKLAKPVVPVLDAPEAEADVALVLAGTSVRTRSITSSASGQTMAPGGCGRCTIVTVGPQGAHCSGLVGPSTLTTRAPTAAAR